MLKIYLAIDYVAIDGGEWRQVGYARHMVSEKDLDKTIPLNFMSFESAYEYLSNNKLSGVFTDTTLLKHKPVIRINYVGSFDPVSYRRFSTMAYQTRYKEMPDVTLEWIMKNLSADECIQYLKDRGMTACPIMK